MDQITVLTEIERCETEGNAAKKRGDYEISFLMLDNARRLREKISEPLVKTMGVQST